MYTQGVFAEDVKVNLYVVSRGNYSYYLGIYAYKN